MSSEDIRVENATISLDIGDLIIDNVGKQYNIDEIEYDNAMVYFSHFDKSYTFPFAAFSNGKYKKVIR